MVEYPIRVLVVDDSAYMRKAIREMLEKSPYVEVVGTARDGQDALDKVIETRPHVVVVDLIMLGMDGVSFIRAQMARKPIPIVVCSSTAEGGEKFIQAMEAGAIDFVRKPTELALDSMYNIQKELVEAISTAAAIDTDKLKLPEAVEEIKVEPVPINREARKHGRVDAVLIGVSTGGPRALRVILPRFPKDLPVPVAVVLHMPPGYTQPLAERLNELCQMEVVESREGLEMLPGRIILAKSGLHTRLRRTANGQVVVTLAEALSDNLYCPSVDELFRSGVEAYDGRLLGVVMTGMGNDGTAGAAWIKGQGGVIIAESEESSVVYGMPRSVVEAGLVDRIVHQDLIPEAIMELVA